MNKIVVAIDSFKGSLSSREAAEAAEQGIKTGNPDGCFPRPYRSACRP